MNNNIIYDTLQKEFGQRKMLEITNIISTLYDIKYSFKKNSDEFDFERQWWMDKHLELIKNIEVCQE